MLRAVVMKVGASRRLIKTRPPAKHAAPPSMATMGITLPPKPCWRLAALRTRTLTKPSPMLRMLPMVSFEPLMMSGVRTRAKRGMVPFRMAAVPLSSWRCPQAIKKKGRVASTTAIQK
ncbi:hypothetical protein D3C86_1242890 [compost metagenome]